MSTSTTSPAAQRVVTLSPLNICWILHVVIELPTGLIGLLQPNAVPLANMSEGFALVVRFLGTSLIASSVTAVLCFGLPDYLPGKRAFAVQLLIFHAIVSALWLQANPTVVQVEFPVALRAYLPPPERIPFTKLVGVLHGLLSLVISGWWQATVPVVQQAARQASSHAKSH